MIDHAKETLEGIRTRKGKIEEAVRILTEGLVEDYGVRLLDVHVEWTTYQDLGSSKKTPVIYGVNAVIKFDL